MPTAMKREDVTVVCDAYRNGLVPLKAAALTLGIYRRQKTKPTPLTVPDLIEWTGAKRSQAYEAVQMVNLFLAARPHASESPEIPESRNPGFPDDPSGNPGQTEPPPYQPPCIEGLREKETHIAHASGDVDKAVQILAAHIDTGHVAQHLMRHATDRDIAAVAEDGWRLESAALKFTSSAISQDIRTGPARSACNYLLAIARGLRRPYAPPEIAAPEAAGEPDPDDGLPPWKRAERERRRKTKAMWEAELAKAQAKEKAL